MSQVSHYKVRTPIELSRGEGRPINITVYSNSQHTTTSDISSNSISFGFKIAKKTSDTPLISKSSTSIVEIEKTDPTHGVFQVKISTSDTGSLLVGSYKFDCFLQDSSTTPVTKAIIVSGELIISEASSL